MRFRDSAARTVWLTAVILVAGPARSEAFERTDPAAKLVDVALRAELDGTSNRQELLAPVLAKSPGSAAARWHAGYVRAGGRWLHVEKYIERNVDSRKLLAYRKIRDQIMADDQLTSTERHRKLAEWCERNGLPQRQKAHLTRLLEESPNDDAARTRLGHVNVNGAWLQPQERDAARVRAKRAAQTMMVWRPRLERLGVLLQTGGDGPPWKRELIHQKAVEQWDAIDDPEAIPAMEAVFSPLPIPGVVRREFKAARAPGSLAQSPSLSEVPIPPQARYLPSPLMVIDKLGQISVPEAAVSLARHAVFCTLQEVRGAAVGRLKARPVEHYVPVLLAALRTPMQVRAELYRTPDGRLLHRQMYCREGQQQRELAVLDTVFTFGGGDQRIAAGRVMGSVASRQRALAAAARTGRLSSSPLNTRICEVLAATTGEQLESSPENWWNWWNDYNEIHVEGEKPIVRTNRRQDVVVYGDRPKPQPDRSATTLRWLGQLTRKECLAAGTPVWTDRGPVAIKEIRVGDIVLSQDTETGELAFKAVLRTTSRVPEKMVEFATDDETFETSGGHRFWVSAAGWKRARVFEPGSRLYGLLQTHEVRSARVVDPKPTYNLIVADFHTYFVGKSRILSHDNTIPTATGAVVPGLAASGN